jgi:hypothetical protein
MSTIALTCDWSVSILHMDQTLSLVEPARFLPPPFLPPLLLVVAIVVMRLLGVTPPLL